ncbi:MAG: prenyltransferase/squalene oxidase repeat-containing protein, partial [Candidatus Thorarchaeota archaeon]
YYAIDPFAGIPDAGGVQTWLLARQILDFEQPEFVGGFEEGNGTEVPGLVTTYFALSAIETLNTLSTVNVTAAEAFVLNCQTPEGSFSNAPGHSTGKLVYSGYACEILSMSEFDGAMSILSSESDPFAPGGTGFEWRTYVIVGIIVIVVLLAVLAVRAD